MVLTVSTMVSQFDAWLCCDTLPQYCTKERTKMRRIVPVWILCTDGRILQGWIPARILRGVPQTDFQLIVDEKHQIPLDKILEIQDLLVKIC